jgi:hypothetical protein
VVVELLVVLVVVVSVVVVGSSDVELVVEVDTVGMEVVVVEVLHSVQQLPSVAVPPRASHRTALKMRQRWDPFAVVHRHATRSVVPHVERAAHLTIVPLQAAGSVSAATSARAAYATHWT